MLLMSFVLRLCPATLRQASAKRTLSCPGSTFVIHLLSVLLHDLITFCIVIKLKMLNASQRVVALHTFAYDDSRR